MKKDIIIIGGKEVGVAWCEATEIAFYKYTSKGVSEFDANNPEHVLYLILSAVLAYYQHRREEAPIKSDDLLYDTTAAERGKAMEVISNLITEWYKIPEGEPQEEEDEGKNA